MSKYFIIARSEMTQRALQTFANLTNNESLERDGNIPAYIDSGTGLPPDKLYEVVAQRLESFAHDTPEKPTVLVDSISWKGLNPLAQGGWSTTVAMLILAFPTLRWVFGVIQGGDVNASRSHGLLSLFEEYLDPIFDGTGLRDHVKSLARDTKNRDGNRVAGFLPLRKQWAAAMDDEIHYAYFNAYTAFRFGFRAFAVRRNGQALRLFAENKAPADLGLTFEDIFLNFPDRRQEDVYSDLYSEAAGSRRTKLQDLAKAGFRIFVTSSQTQTGSLERRHGNKAYIREGAGAARAYEVCKPLSGMFDLWDQAGLFRKLSWPDPETGRQIRGCGEGFYWPPPRSFFLSEGETGHGSPGRLLQIAECLVRRAEALLHFGVTSVREAVWGAVLATEALELLGDRTPTTAIDALGLKHRFEVMAECQFSGVEYHLEVKKRLDEIRRETETLAGWFHPDQIQKAAWNAEMHIVNHLVRILRDNNQFDEEAICMNRVRKLHNRLWVRNKPFIFRPPLLASATYASWLMASFSHFVISLASCVVSLAGLHWWLETTNPSWDDIPNPGSPLRPIVIGFQTVFAFFIGANNLDDNSWGMSLILGLAALLGLVHLGIFLSFLYSVIARKS